MLERFTRETGHGRREPDRLPPSYGEEDELPFGNPPGGRESVNGKKNTWTPNTWRELLREDGTERPAFSDLPRMSRRQFIGGIAGLAAGPAVIAASVDYAGKYSPLARWLDDKIEGQFDYDEVVKEAKEFFWNRYRMTLMMGMKNNEHPRYRGDDVELLQYRESLKVLMQEMSLYPGAMIRKAGSDQGLRMRLAQKLQYHTKNDKGEMEWQDCGGAAPFFKPGVQREIFIGIDNALSFQRRTLHHELNHIFSYSWQHEAQRTATWIGFHKDVTSTPYRGLNLQAPADPPPDARYFLTGYAASNVLEDQATTAEWMMTPDLMAEYWYRWSTEKDQTVKKILEMKYTETTKNYEDWSDGQITKSFWQAMGDRGNEQRTRMRQLQKK